MAKSFLKSFLIDEITPEMEERTNSKYDKWDFIIEQDILESGTSEEMKLAYALLNDPSIYAYAFFRDPKDPKKKFRLYPYQDMIINDEHKRILFAAANQIGKSITLCIKALHFALLNPGKTVLMVSKTFPQSKDLLRQIRSFLQYSILDYKFDIGDSETKTEISFKHYKEVTVFDKKLNKEVTKTKELPQSRIVCVPATEAALGYAADLVLEDEQAFWENGSHMHNQVLQPRTYTTKGQIIIFSNPNGQQGIMWELWNNKDYHRYKFTFLDCPTNTQEEFDRISKSLTREQIDSTMLAIFTSPEGGFLTLAERKDMQEERMNCLPSVITQPIYIAFDWAKSRDRTVRTIGIPVKKGENEWSDEIYVYEMKEYPGGTSYTEIVDVDLKKLIKDTGPQNVAMVGWDNNGVGSGIQDFISRVEQLGIQAMPVSFALENKSRIYTLFKLLAEQRRIKLPYVQECDKQLSMLRFKTSQRGCLQVHHESESDRDDFPDSLAILSSLIINPENPPVTCEII